jgi:hypothetical protein
VGRPDVEGSAAVALATVAARATIVISNKFFMERYPGGAVDRCRSGTIVVQYPGGWSFNARDRAQVLIDGTNISVAQTLIQRPRHDLQQSTIEGLGSWKAIADYGRRTVRMEVINILTGT